MRDGFGKLTLAKFRFGDEREDATLAPGEPIGEHEADRRRQAGAMRADGVLEERDGLGCGRERKGAVGRSKPREIRRDERSPCPIDEGRHAEVGAGRVDERREDAVREDEPIGTLVARCAWIPSHRLPEQRRDEVRGRHRDGRIADARGGAGLERGGRELDRLRVDAGIERGDGRRMPRRRRGGRGDRREEGEDAGSGGSLRAGRGVCIRHGGISRPREAIVEPSGANAAAPDGPELRKPSRSGPAPEMAPSLRSPEGRAT